MAEKAKGTKTIWVVARMPLTLASGPDIKPGEKVELDALVAEALVELERADYTTAPEITKEQE